MKLKYNIYSRNIYIKILFFFALLLVLIPILNLNTYACTIFTKQQGDKVLVGNNEDFNYSFKSYVWFVAQSEGSYGRVCFANSSYVQGGMNEKGLFYDGAQCPATETPYTDDKPTLGMDLGEVVLSKCSNIDEAVEFLKNYNIPKGYGDHILFTDETGNAVIVEWVEGEMKIVPKKLDYQIATNYFLSNPKLGGYPCNRYDTAKSMLEDENEISIESFKNILSATSQVWDGGGTKYSNIYDLKNKVVYIFCKRDYSKYAYYNMTDELKKLKQGEKRIYEVDKLEYKTFENISSNASLKINVISGDKSIADSSTETNQTEKYDNSIKQAKEPIQMERYNYIKQVKDNWGYGIAVVVAVLALFYWIFIKKRINNKNTKV